MTRLLFASSNAHKTQEIRQLLGEGWEVLDLRDFPKLPIPEETGSSFDANARIKAESASAVLPDLLVLADDSGLEVDVLGGEPGVHSARYAGPSATDRDNREKLKASLGILAVGDLTLDLTARFRCCMALAKGGETLITCDGAVEGSLLLEDQGEGGFGYDPLFVPQGFTETFGVLPAETKNQLSHRARALKAMVAWMQSHLSY